MNSGPPAATILLFAKEPRPGRVKTRLVPPLTAQEAADFAAAFLRDLWVTLSGLPCADVLVALPDDDSSEAVARLLGGDASFTRQGPGNLGERLARTTSAVFSDRPGPVAVVGSDHPDLPAACVEACLRDARGGRIGWISTEDGGYAALALPRALPSLFEDVPWSTRGVAAATRDSAARLGLELVDHGPWYDVDTVEDLGRLSGVLESGAGCPATRRALERLDPPLALRNPR